MSERRSKEDKKKPEKRQGTLSALLKDKPKRGRPRRAVSRQNVYVALAPEQKQRIKSLTKELPAGLGRADIADLAISLLSARFEVLRHAVADRNREIPEGITDLDSLYLLWDLPLPGPLSEPSWTSIRVSPQQTIDLGRVQGILNALFGANRSQVFALGLALLEQFLGSDLAKQPFDSLEEVQHWFDDIYL